MAQSAWHQVKEIFHEALERDPGEREAFLDSACDGDHALREEVESLLAADDDSFPWLDSPVFEAAAETLAGEEDERLPSLKLGPYEIVHKLGQGGMGAVYLGQRKDDQYERRVAIKVVRRDLADREAIRRFRQERQILASLDHPHIAQLLDGGVTDEGLPYFIMEYIEGVPIDLHCDREKLGLEARIDLFRKVCSAVQFAHRHLVVHCDLKPSNILVTEDGEPKLLDFGIARLLSTEFVPRAVTVTLSADDHRLTPEYASPEQVHGERMTTASDVYSLGVLLYRLLTGTLPFHFRSRMMWEIERVIREEDPTKPSEAVDLRPLDGSPEKLRRMLDGDLDNIVLMAVRKDPGERYPSVENFSEDLRRHREGLPVLARKDTVRYRATKFIRRNRAWVAAAALTALSLIMGILATTWMAYVATAERSKAERERLKSEKVSDFLGLLFQGADPSWEKWRSDLTVRELLDEGAKQVETELVEQPEVHAEVMYVMGMAYLHLASFDEASRFLEEARAIRRRVVGSEHPQYAESLFGLCSLWRERGEYEKARPFCTLALDLWRRFPEMDVAENIVESLNELGLVLRHLGLYQEAEARYREGLALGQRLLGEDHLRVAMIQHNLGGVLRLQGRFEEAKRLLQHATKLYRDQLGSDHPVVAAGLNTLAALFSNMGEFEAAESAYLEALEIWQTVRPEHPEVAIVLNNLGALHYVQEDYEPAGRLFYQALELYRKNEMGERQEVVIILNHLGALRLALGDLPSAESNFREALALGRQRFGPTYSSFSVSLIGLGQVLTATGKPREAEDLLTDALRIREDHYSEGHWRTANAKSHLGACLTALGRFQEAEAYLLEAYRVLAEQRGGEHKYTNDTLRRIIDLYESWSRPTVAANYRALLLN